VGKPVLLILSHSIEEAMQVDLLSSLGYDVFSLGGYIDPLHPHDPKRPAVPHAPRHPELQAIVDGLGRADNIGAAAADIPDGILEWLGDDGIIIAHHYLEERIYPQWPRLRDWMDGAPGRRVIRRTVGQSVEGNEQAAARFVGDGLETVRYSPCERAIPGYSGEDALIRFWMDDVAYGGWTGDLKVVGNVTQRMMARHPATNAEYAHRAIATMPTMFAGPESEEGFDGLGELTWDDMREYLAHLRVYLYTGTQPASYTLGLLEAMMTGVPVVSIGPSWMRQYPAGPAMFEGHTLATTWSDDPLEARAMMRAFLMDADLAAEASREIRGRALELFGRGRIGAQWSEFLG
jgi:hypothetical protein